jgi:PST family polysaccharide transporter
MAETGGASLLSALLGLLASKILAVAAGPAAIAVLATLQQVRTAAVTAATLNGSTALVQGACALRGRARREYLRTTLVLMAGATACITSLLLLAPGAVARWAGIDASLAGPLRLLAFAVLLGVAYVFLAALLNALRALRRLALAQIAAPAALAFLAWPVARSLGVAEAWSAAHLAGWLAAWLAASALAAALAAGVMLRSHWTELAGWFQGEGAWWRQEAARRFLRFSATLFASGLVYSGVVVAVRAAILRMEGLERAGTFDAAWAISMNQATLVLASLQTHYLPALSAPGSESGRAAHIQRVLILGAAAAALLLAALIVGKPLLIRLLYSEAFLGAGSYLGWMLPGDYLKVTSWILSLPLVAAGDMRAFLAADLCAYAVYAAVATLIARWLPAGEAAAIAFVGMYAAHLLICGARLWITGAFRPDRRTAVAWLAGGALVAAAAAATWGQG